MSAVVALVLGGAFLLLFLAGTAWRWHRSVAERVVLAATRLEEGEGLQRVGLPRALSRLEAAVERAVEEGGESAVAGARLVRALDAIPQGVVICDEHGAVVFRNQAAAEFFGGRHGEVLVEAAIKEMVEAAVEGTEARRTMELYGPPRRTLLVHAAPLDDGRRTTGALAVVEDVSERRRLDAMRRDFVANISHELKTPVGALSLLAETIATETDTKLIRRLAQRMEVESVRVGRTIDDLLDLSRIEAEEAPMREPVPVHLVLGEAAERVRPGVDNKGIVLDVEEPARRLSVLGDRRQLVSAVYNLLDNAIKYSDSGSRVEAWATTDGSWVEVVVRDHGYGIPARDLERIFERFYRVDRARSRETGGTGLGLAIVRHVATNHHGDVRVESREGEGSTFILRLPAGPGPVAISSSPQADSA